LTNNIFLSKGVSSELKAPAVLSLEDIIRQVVLALYFLTA
jgi:hypothetical protein